MLSTADKKKQRPGKCTCHRYTATVLMSKLMLQCKGQRSNAMFGLLVNLDSESTVYCIPDARAMHDCKMANMMIRVFYKPAVTLAKLITKETTLRNLKQNHRY